MVDRQRRRPTPAAALARRAAAPILLGALLWSCGRGADVQAHDRAPDRAQADGARAGMAPAAPVYDDDLRAGSLNGRVRRTIRAWIERARERSKGKASAANVHVAALVVDLASGVELAAVGPEEAHLPASNMKLVTTAAALVLLGPGTEFLTPFEGTGPVEGGTLAGDLVVRASGDPICASDGDARVEARLGAVARELRERGVRRISGDVVLDQGTFADPAPGPAWPDPGQYWQEYCALAAGFTVNGGVLQARVLPRAAGRAADVEVHPAPYGLRSKIDVRTISGKRLDVRVGASVSTVTVVGEIPAARGEYLAEFAHPDPVALFGSVLLDQLEKNGVRVDGRLRRERGVAPATRLAELRSPVDDILVPINTASVNGVADQLFLALGHAISGSGTREGGSEATARALERLGVPRDGLVQVDGSGLSRDDRVTARQITTLIRAVLRRDETTARIFLDSLAVGGERGTLEDRFVGTPSAGRIHAKTGWITGASAISGVCDTLDGRRLVFSILVGYPAPIGGLNAHCFKPMQDEILRMLVEEEL